MQHANYTDLAKEFIEQCKGTKDNDKCLKEAYKKYT